MTINSALQLTCDWLDTLVGNTGELPVQELQELFVRIQLDNLPLVIFQDPEGFSKWVVGLDERETGKTVANCYWLDSGFITAAEAVRWCREKFGEELPINYIGKIQLHSPVV